MENYYLCLQNCLLDFFQSNKLSKIYLPCNFTNLIGEICNKQHISEQSCQNKHHVYQKELTIVGQGEIGKHKHLWPLTTKYWFALLVSSRIARPTYSFLVFNIDKALPPLTIWLEAPKLTNTISKVGISFSTLCTSMFDSDDLYTLCLHFKKKSLFCLLAKFSPQIPRWSPYYGRAALQSCNKTNIECSMFAATGWE